MLIRKSISSLEPSFAFKDASLMRKKGIINKTQSMIQKKPAKIQNPRALNSTLTLLSITKKTATGRESKKTNILTIILTIWYLEILLLILKLLKPPTVMVQKTVLPVEFPQRKPIAIAPPVTNPANSVVRAKDGSSLAGGGEDWNSCWSQDNIMFCLGDT